ncbi:hypothetical protein GCM10007352_00320 [Mucilaginibacter phyllosphaerae]|nr:hypothetical protein GCM10007352_00320 [Mucilaginibacter phyllosphaerae]
MYINAVCAGPGVIAVSVNVTVAAVNPFAGYPISIGIRRNWPCVNRLNGLFYYITFACTGCQEKGAS